MPEASRPLWGTASSSQKPGVAQNGRENDERMSRGWKVYSENGTRAAVASKISLQTKNSECAPEKAFTYQKA